MTDLNKFVQDAIRTEARIPFVTVNRPAFDSITQSLIAIGNLLDMIKKNAFYGKEIDPLKFQQFVAIATNNVNNLNDIAAGLQTQDVFNTNLEILDVNSRMFHAIVGMATESVELVEALVKAINGEDIDGVNIKEELGDFNWYEAIAIDTLEVSFEEVLNTVIAKLKARYPDKFTATAAIERDLATERKILESRNEEV